MTAEINGIPRGTIMQEQADELWREFMEAVERQALVNREPVAA